ncbi:MAG: FkbM family methyltransferase [Chitinophagaceae bacterium]|nr:FkbM family methyltransferase [Chitinophagaceae bacterium]
MLEILKPFFHVLTGRKFVVSRWGLLKTLLKLAFLKRLFPGKTDVVVKFGPFTINAPDYHMLSILLKEKFVYNEYLFETSSDAPIIIDGGANIGISVLYFKSLYPNSIIHCFEPYSKAYGFLERNIKQNNLANIHLNKLALSGTQQTTQLFIPDTNGTINATINSSLASEKSEPVETAALSSYIASFPNIDLVKLDIEAAEVAVVNELHKSNAFKNNKIKNLVVEFHASTMSDPGALEQFVSLLNSHSYSVSYKVLNPRSEKSDYLVVAAL